MKFHNNNNNNRMPKDTKRQVLLLQGVGWILRYKT